MTKSWIAVGAKGLASLLCAALVWEGVSRAFILYRPPRTVLANGASIAPGPVVQWQEGYGRTSFSEKGVRRAETSPNPSLRVLVLGDSNTEALQVSDEETYAAQIQSQLSRNGINAQVLNLGRGGASPDRYIALAPYYLREFSPDLTIIQVSDNDFVGDFQTKSGDFYSLPDDKGFRIETRRTVNDVDGAWKLVEPFSLGQALRSQYLSAKRDFRASIRKAKALLMAPSQPDPPSAGADEQSTRHMEWSLRRLRALYPNLILVYIPVLDYFGDYTRMSPMESAFYEACRREDIQTVACRTEFASRFERSAEVAHGFLNTAPGAGHINALGHRLIGAMAADVILSLIADLRRSRKGLLPTPSGR